MALTNQQLQEEYNRVFFQRIDAIMNGGPSNPEWDAILQHPNASSYAASKLGNASTETPPVVPAQKATTAASVDSEPATQTTTAPAQKTYAQVEQAFFDKNKRWAQGDELNQFAAANGLAPWIDGPPAPRTATTNATTTAITGGTNLGAADGAITTTGGAVTGGAVTGGGAAGGSQNQSGAVTGGDAGAHERNIGGEAQASLNAILGFMPQFADAYGKFSGQIGKSDLTNLRNSMFGSVDADTFLAEHDEFKQGYNNAKAQGQDAQAWLDQAVGSSTYLDQGAIKRGGGLFDINKALTTETNQQTVDANSALRAGNVADATKLGKESLSLLKDLNPNQYSSLGGVNTSAVGGIQPNTYQSQLGSLFNQGPQFQSVGASQNPLLGYANYEAATAGPSMLGNDLNSMARSQLALGGQASPWEMQQAEQAAREAWGARGLVMSPGAVGAEIINRDDLQRQRLMERQQFAAGVEQLGQSQQGINKNFMLGALGANATQGAQNLQAGMTNQGADLAARQLSQGLGLNLMGTDYGRQQQNFGNQVTNAQLQGASAFNPFSMITSAGTANQGTNPSLFAAGGGVSSGGAGNSNLFGMMNPQSAYAGNLFGQNYAGLEDAKVNAAEMSAAKQAGWMQLAGSVIGAGGAVGAAKVAGAAKVVMMCIPEGEFIDTPSGAKTIADIRAGDWVNGFNGTPAVVLQKHEYAENPEAIRFFRFNLDNGESLAACDNHRIIGKAAKEWRVGDTLGTSTILSIEVFGGVHTSYDLLTTDEGYSMAGVPVNSMIEEMAQRIAQMSSHV